MEKEWEDCYYYLDKAYEATNGDDVKKYANKALELDENCIDAALLLLELKNLDIEEYKINLEELINKESVHLKNKEMFKEDNMGNFYMIIETRPYMRANFELFGTLVALGKNRCAAKLGEQMIVLNNSDNLGLRYHLLGIYALLEEKEKAEQLYKACGEDSAITLLPIIALYYKLDDLKKAKEYLRLLYKKNSNIVKIFLDEVNYDELEMYDRVDGYTVGSIEEVYEALEIGAGVYLATAGLKYWISQELRKLIKE